MRLFAPSSAPAMHFTDIEGKQVAVGGTGRLTLLSFFRDAACPFCNFRIYELTEHHHALAANGLDVVAVFQATTPELRRFVARKPRPFSVIADPTGESHDRYGIGHSFWRKIKAILTRVPTLIRGLRIVGLAGLKTNNRLPADFLIDRSGHIVEAWYGGDAGDRIPFSRIEEFIAAYRNRGVTVGMGEDAGNPAHA